MIIIPFLNGYFIGNINPTFSDKPICTPGQAVGCVHYVDLTPKMMEAAGTDPASPAERCGSSVAVHRHDRASPASPPMPPGQWG